MKVPATWLAEHCDPGLDPGALAERLSMTGTEVERVDEVDLDTETETALELEVTPNRVDCFGIYGVAREVHAVTGAPLNPEPWAEDAEATGEGEASNYASVTVEVPELCPRFTARVFTDVKVDRSPRWLAARLVAAGQRPVNNVVDITNYVMLLTAQPLHAFDLDKVPGGEIIVRTARKGERMTTLDGVEREFDTQSVLVCDRDGPSGIAGIMGGEHSEVSDSTARVLLEAATWDGVNILRTSGKLALRSEASTRFEKQLHPALAMRAQRVASRLLVELCGAKLVPGTIDVAEPEPEPQVLTLRSERVQGLLGMEVPKADQVAYLARLGFGVTDGDGEALRVKVPPDRHYDVTREADLVEEVARVHGIAEHLPSTLPEHGQAGRLAPHQALRRRVEDAMRDLGFCEVVAWSFNDPSLDDRLRLPADDPRRERARIRNPLSEVGSAMRTTLLGGLLDAARYNLAHGAGGVALFESGRVYLRDGAPPYAGADPVAPGREAEEAAGVGSVLAGAFAGERPPPFREPHRLGALLVGSLRPASWSEPTGPAAEPLFELKGVLEALCAGLEAEVSAAPEAQPFLHPARCARIELGGAAAGWLGELHPLVCKEWDLPGGVAFEFDLAPLAAAARSGHEAYEDVTTHPAVLQDIAVVVADDVPAQRVREAVLAGGGELLREASVFDLYHGEQLEEGRKSLALRLAFQAPDRTLTDDEVAGLRKQIESELEKVGGSLRE